MNVILMETFELTATKAKFKLRSLDANSGACSSSCSGCSMGHRGRLLDLSLGLYGSDHINIRNGLTSRR